MQTEGRSEILGICEAKQDKLEECQVVHYRDLSDVCVSVGLECEWGREQP